MTELEYLELEDQRNKEQAERNAKWLAEWKRKPEYKPLLCDYLKRMAEIAGR